LGPRQRRQVHGVVRRLEVILYKDMQGILIENTIIISQDLLERFYSH